MQISTLSRVAAVALVIAIAAGCKREPPADAGASAPVAPRPAAPARWQQVVEAENGTALTAPLVVQDQADASGGKCVAIPLGQPKDVAPTGSIKFTLTAPREAEITLWYRVHWAGTCSNSFTAKVAGQPDLIIGEDGTYQTWHWVKTPPMTVPAGPLEVTIMQREEDVRLDQVLVTTDADYVPMGIEE